MLSENPKKNIRTTSLDDLTRFFIENGEKAFRAKQVHEWVWKKSLVSFDEMTNISKNTRDLLAQHYTFNTLEIKSKQVSNDGTIKMAFSLYDNNIVEGVMIPTKDRKTACISTQVGCSLACEFCATGKLKRVRNLSYDEIYDQVVEINRITMEKYGEGLTNIVYMGMGEPLLNYNNTLTSIEKITSPDGLNMASRRITISTAGIAKMIKKLADDKVKVNLALSLHAANDEKRDKIMAINEQNSLESLAEALTYYHQKTGKKVTYEYCLFKDYNDTIDDAKQLIAFAQHVPCKVNLIEYNAIDDGIFQRSSDEVTDQFANYLRKNKVPASIRRSRGKDIDAACGQLANKN